MMKSISSAVSGLRSQQTAMDVIGNNIANVNTPGFKASNTTFTDVYYQTLRMGNEAVNPTQVGYGARVGGVVKDMSTTGATTTNNPLDLYISGDEFFAVNTKSDGSGATYFTRLGNFHINYEGYLVDQTGNFVMGATEKDGQVQPSAPISLMGASFHTSSGQVIKITPDAYSALTNIQVTTTGTISAYIGEQPGVISNDTATGVTYSGDPVSDEGKVNGTKIVDAAGNTVTDANGPIDLTDRYVRDASGKETKLDDNATIGKIIFNPDKTITVHYEVGETDYTGTLITTPVLQSYTGAPTGTVTVDASGNLKDGDGNAVNDESGNPINLKGYIYNAGTGSPKVIDTDFLSTITGVTCDNGKITITTDDGDGTLENPRTNTVYTSTPSRANVGVNGQVYDAKGNAVADGGGNPLNVMGMTILDANGAGMVVNSSNIQYITGVTFNGDNTMTVSYTLPGGIAATGTLLNVQENDLTIGLAQFVNRDGLYQVGDSYYTANMSSGKPSYVMAGVGNSTEIRSGELEMSNVDLTKEFTTMIVTQRGFQANSRVITVSDSMLEELVNLKR